MPLPKNNHHVKACGSPRGVQAFSLIEIAIALGITSVGLIAILGMVPVGLTAMRDSIENTTIALISNGVASNLRAKTKDDFEKEVTAYYFDDQGRESDSQVAGGYTAKATVLTRSDTLGGKKLVTLSLQVSHHGSATQTNTQPASTTSMVLILTPLPPSAP